MRFTIIALLAAASAVLAQDTVVATRSGVCEPHDDHWHCPSGVPKPTVPPNALSAATPAPSLSASHSHDDDDHDHDHAATASTCEPHGDHWHCPSGVPQPSTRPAAASAVSGTSVRASSTSAGSAAASSRAPGAAPQVQGVQGAALAVVGAVGAWLL